MKLGSGVFGSRVTRAIIKENAPQIVSGVLKWWLERNGSKEVYEFLMGGGDIFDMVPEQHRHTMESLKPWNLDWLTLEWLLKTVSKHAPATAAMIASSPALISRLIDSLHKLKEEFSEPA